MSKEKTLSLKFNVPIFKMDLLSVNWEKVIIKNDNIKVLEGVYEGVGTCSVIVLYNIEKHIDEFYKISNQINTYVNLNLNFMAKLFGIIVDKEKFCLIFEKLKTSVEVLHTSKLLRDTDRYNILLDVMELLLSMHENKLRLCDIRPSNVFLNEHNDVRMIYPLGNICYYSLINMYPLYC